MFLLPSVALGLVFALLLGGKLSRLLDIRLRHGWTVFLALGLQAALFTPLRDQITVPPELESPLHLASYALLFIFAAVNVHNLALLPLFLGMVLNAVAIAANGGSMPVSRAAWAAAGLQPGDHPNVRLGGDRLTFLGDVFALPREFPLANVFSVGDLLIGFGTIALIVAVATSDGSTRALVPSRIVRPLHDSSFRRLAVGKLVSHLGDWLTLAALVSWVYAATGSTTDVAVLMLIRLAPPILGGGLAAAVVDRLPKERLLVGVEILRGLAVGGALFAVLSENRPLAFAAVAVSGALAAVSSATVRAIVPSLLGDEHLLAANAGLGIAQDAAMALGALGAGVALSTSHTVTALVVDLGTFVVAGTLYAGIRVRRTVREDDEPAPGGVVQGLRYVLRRRALLVVVGAFGAATLATGLTNTTLPRFLDELGLGVGGYGFGLSALAWGLATGQAIVGFTRVGPTAGRWIGAGLLFMAVLFVGLAFTVHAPTALLILALIGLLDGTTDVLFDTIVQRESDPRYYGRVFGLASAFMTTTMMGAVAAAPLVNRLAPPREIVILAGLALVVASSVALVGSIRGKAREAPEENGADEEERALAPVLTLVPRSEPALEPESVPVPAEETAAFRVLLRLSDGERVRVAACADAAQAEECARDVVRHLSQLAPDEWPFVGGRYIRPTAVISVDIAEDLLARWLDAGQPGSSSAPGLASG
ncbi:MAG: MFS transporter [Gaiellaceae bacterium]